MPFKTILVYCDADIKLDDRVRVAARLAETHDAHLVGSYVRPPFQPPVVFDAGFAVAMDDFFAFYEERTAADQSTASTVFAESIKGMKLSSEWRRSDGQIDREFAMQARYADLTVIGQSDPEGPDTTPSDLPQYVALASGRPVLVIPNIGVSSPPGSNVLLCWNGSREAARAASEALPILKAADRVTVLTVAQKSATLKELVTVDRVDPWLGRHGIKAAMLHDVSDADEVGGFILSRAADLGADLIIMGLYGHSRAREFVLGGASRTMLASMTVPVLFAH